MKRIISLSLTFLCFAIAAFTQESSGLIKGQVNTSAKSLEGASVQLLTSPGNKLVTTVVTNADGTYQFARVQSGSFIIRVTAVGFNTYQSDIIKLTDGAINTLKPIVLSIATKSLKEVTITAKRPFIEQKPGKTLINVEASPTNGGLNALELLEKSPGVTVDKDGNVSLQGKTGVMILVDGKQTYLSGADLATLLKTIQSNNLDQIEIMTNPPARYDAAGNSGIINIKTKKATIKGMNGSFSNTYTQGFYARTNNSVSLNYRNNKLNIFGNYGFNYNENFNKLTIDRNFYRADKSIAGTSDQQSRPHSQNINNSIKTGVDYYFSKKDVVGFVVNANLSNGKEDPTGFINVRDAPGKIMYSLNTINKNKSEFLNISTNVNFKHTFDSTGREITADADYAHYKRQSNNLMTTQTFDGTGNKNGADVGLKGIIPANIDIYSVKVDYVHPVSKSMRLEAGVKSSFVNTDNKVDYTRNNGNGWVADARSNQFMYNENISAAYVTVNKTLKKWNLSGGVRLEHTEANGKQVTNDSSFKRQYTNLFPNIGIGYDANTNNQVNLSYSRRIDRPNYGDLNPFVYFLDSLTYSQGNPYLQPQFTNKVELSHTYKRFLTTTLNYSYTTDVISQLLKQDTEKKVTYQTTDNVNSLQQVGVAFMINTPVNKWWNTNIYLNVYNNHYKGLYQADPIDISYTTFATNITNSFTLPKGWSIEVSGFYRSKGSEGLLVANPMWMVNSGVAKQVMKKKGTVRFGMRDIFLSQRFSGYARYSDVDVTVLNTRDSRQASLSFTYRFGKTNIAPARRKTGGANDEQNRVGGGSN